MGPCTHPGTCREVNEASRPHACSRPCAFEEKKRTQKHEIPPHPKHTCLKMHFFISGNSLRIFTAAEREKAICPTCRVCNPQSSHAPPRRDRGGQNTCLDIPLAGVCRSTLSRKQWRLALSNHDFFLLESSRITGLGCEQLY